MSATLPPSNSVFKIDDTLEGRRILIPKPKRKLGDVGGMLFLAFWLCGWSVGEVLVTGAILTALKKGEFDGGFWFMSAWLGLWTVGGALAIKALCAAVKGAPPEVITLGASELRYKTERPKTYPKAEITNVRLETSEGLHRLSFDHGADRIYIGEHLREPEREWLFSIIKQWKGV